MRRKTCEPRRARCNSRAAWQFAPACRIFELGYVPGVLLQARSPSGLANQPVVEIPAPSPQASDLSVTVNIGSGDQAGERPGHGGGEIVHASLMMLHLRERLTPDFSRPPHRLTSCPAGPPSLRRSSSGGLPKKPVPFRPVRRKCVRSASARPNQPVSPRSGSRPAKWPSSSARRSVECKRLFPVCSNKMMAVVRQASPSK